MRYGWRLVTLVVSLYALCVVIAMGCSKPPTLKQAGAVVEAGCTVYAAFADSPMEQAICATADDVLGMVADIRASRADAAANGGALGRVREAKRCQIVGTVCATDDELAMAIRARRP